MKILRKILVCSCVLAMGTIMFSCDKDKNENGDNPGNVPNPNVGMETPTTPTEQKKFIENTAKEFKDLCKPADQSELVNFLMDFADEFEDFDFEDMDYAPRNSNVGKEMGQMLKSIRKSDWFGVTRSIQNVSYSVADFTGIFEPDYKNKCWKKTADSSNIIYRCKVNGKDAEISAVLTGGEYSESFITWDYDYNYNTGRYEDIEIRNTVRVPRNVKFSLVYNSKTLAEGTVVTDYVKGSSAVADVNVTLANLNVVSSANLNNSECKANYRVKIGGQVILNGEAVLTGNHLCDLDYIQNLYDDDDNYFDDDYDDPAWGLFSTGGFNANILNRMYIAGSCNDIASLLKVCGNADDESESEMKNMVNYINSNVKADFYLGGATEPTGKFTWRLNKYSYNWGYTYTYWEAEPLVSFSDGTTYSFEQYFSEDNFEDVVEMYESLVKTYKSFFKF